MTFVASAPVVPSRRARIATAKRTTQTGVGIRLRGQVTRFACRSITSECLDEQPEGSTGVLFGDRRLGKPPMQGLDRRMASSTEPGGRDANVHVSRRADGPPRGGSGSIARRSSRSRSPRQSFAGGHESTRDRRERQQKPKRRVRPPPSDRPVAPCAGAPARPAEARSARRDHCDRGEEGARGGSASSASTASVRLTVDVLCGSGSLRRLEAKTHRGEPGRVRWGGLTRTRRLKLSDYSRAPISMSAETFLAAPTSSCAAGQRRAFRWPGSTGSTGPSTRWQAAATARRLRRR